MAMGAAEDAATPAIPHQPQPMGIEALVVVPEVDDVEFLLRLAAFAEIGQGDAMEAVLKEVALHPEPAHQELRSTVLSRPGTSKLRRQLLWHALEADDLEIPDRLRPTDAVAAVLGRDAEYQRLANLAKVDSDAERAFKFYILGKLARLAAGR